MPKIRVAAYIDGFNIYHAIDDANRAARGGLNHLKWVNLWSLMACFTDPVLHDIVSVKFFTAYPTWKPDQKIRHREYVKALRFHGVEDVIGRFKRKEVYCKSCKNSFWAHEEKESDVNLAMHLISDAYQNIFDHAFLVTNDSDLLGPVRLFRSEFSEKKIKIVAPPFRRHSKELWAAATNKAKIKQLHLEKCLMPEHAQDKDGNEIFRRPTQYDPN